MWWDALTSAQLALYFIRSVNAYNDQWDNERRVELRFWPIKTQLKRVTAVQRSENYSCIYIRLIFIFITAARPVETVCIYNAKIPSAGFLMSRGTHCSVFIVHQELCVMHLERRFPRRRSDWRMNLLCDDQVVFLICVFPQ